MKEESTVLIKGHNIGDEIMRTRNRHMEVEVTLNRRGYGEEDMHILSKAALNTQYPVKTGFGGFSSINGQHKLDIQLTFPFGLADSDPAVTGEIADDLSDWATDTLRRVFHNKSHFDDSQIAFRFQDINVTYRASMKSEIIRVLQKVDTIFDNLITKISLEDHLLLEAEDICC